MTEEAKTTNRQIAELLKAQTFDERMEMAEIFRGLTIDALNDDRELDCDWFAHAFDNWAEAELEPAQ